VNSPRRSCSTVGAPSGAMLSRGVHFFETLPARGSVPGDFSLLEHAPSSRGIHAGYSLASRRASAFLLRGQEKGTKEKATPKRWSPGSATAPCVALPPASMQSSCPPTPRQGSGGSLTAPPCADSKLGAIPRAHPAGLSYALPPPLRGPDSAHRARQCEEQSQSQSPSATAPCVALPPASMQSSSAFGTFSRLAGEGQATAKVYARVRGNSLRLGCARRAVDGAPMQRQGDGGIARRVGAMDCAQFDASPGMDCRRTPGVALRSRRAGSPETAVSGWPSLWLLSLGHARESDSLAGRRVKTRHGCRATKERASGKQSHWTPACAGVTRDEGSVKNRHGCRTAKRHRYQIKQIHSARAFGRAMPRMDQVRPRKTPKRRSVARRAGQPG
jgi:hypothetical protein